MELTRQTKQIIFWVLVSSCILCSAIQTALNTALPPILAEMNIAAQTAQWLVSAYSLVMGIMVLATAYLIKRFPCRQLYISSMALFCGGLFFAAASTSFWVLLLGRVMQALGCGVLMSLAQVVVFSVFTPEERGGKMGIYGLAVCAAPALAPTISGIVIDLAGWRMIFWGTLVLGLGLLAVGLATVKNVTPNQEVCFDLFSMATCALGFVGIVLGLGNIGNGQLLNLQVLLPLVIGATALLAFIYRQNKLRLPFLNLKIFRNREFRLAVIASMLLYCGMIAVSTLLPLYNQSIRG